MDKERGRVRVRHLVLMVRVRVGVGGGLMSITNIVLTKIEVQGCETCVACTRTHMHTQKSLIITTESKLSELGLYHADR